MAPRENCAPRDVRPGERAKFAAGGEVCARRALLQRSGRPRTVADGDERGEGERAKHDFGVRSATDESSSEESPVHQNFRPGSVKTRGVKRPPPRPRPAPRRTPQASRIHILDTEEGPSPLPHRTPAHRHFPWLRAISVPTKTSSIFGFRSVTCWSFSSWYRLSLLVKYRVVPPRRECSRGVAATF